MSHSEELSHEECKQKFRELFIEHVKSVMHGEMEEEEFDEIIFGFQTDCDPSSENYAILQRIRKNMKDYMQQKRDGVI